MVILSRADHCHFMDNAEEMHETIRTMPWIGELAWLPKEMRPIAELCSGDQAHLYARGLTLCRMDAILRRLQEAQQFLLSDLKAELSERGVELVFITRDVWRKVANADGTPALLLIYGMRSKPTSFHPLSVR